MLYYGKIYTDLESCEGNNNLLSGSLVKVSSLWVFETLIMGSSVVEFSDGNDMIAYTYLSFDTLQTTMFLILNLGYVTEYNNLLRGQNLLMLRMMFNSSTIILVVHYIVYLSLNIMLIYIDI